MMVEEPTPSIPRALTECRVGMPLLARSTTFLKYFRTMDSHAPVRRAMEARVSSVIEYRFMWPTRASVRLLLFLIFGYLYPKV